MPNPKLETYKNKATGDVYDFTDAAAQAALAGILDGTDIDSFSDVETALATKVDKVTGKGLSTNDYDNTAKGIVDNIQSNVIANTKLIKDTVGWSGKNKIWADYYDGRSKTKNGITATVNNDGSITFNGTATGTFGFVIFQVRPSEFHKRFKVGDKCTILGCPANGSAFTYYLRLATDPWAILGDDYGEGKNITITDQSGKTWVKLSIGIDSGQTMNNVTFYPMICDTDILDKTFESPFSSTAFPRSEQAVLGAKNFLYVLDPTGTQSDVTYTVNKDSKGNVLNVAVSGTPTGYSAFAFWADVTPNKYILSHMDNAANFIWGEITLYKNEASVQDLPSLGTADDCTIDLSSYDFDRIKVVAKRVSNSVNTTATIYPMLRLATDTDSNYVPHVMTNEQLTDAVTKKTIQYASKSDAIATLNKAYIKKVGSVCQCVIDFVVGSANINAWTNLVTFSENTGISPGSNQIIAIRDVTDTTKSSIVGAVINSGNLQLGGTLIAEHRYMASFSYIAES